MRRTEEAKARGGAGRDLFLFEELNHFQIKHQPASEHISIDRTSLASILFILRGFMVAVS